MILSNSLVTISDQINSISSNSEELYYTFSSTNLIYTVPLSTSLQTNIYLSHTPDVSGCMIILPECTIIGQKYTIFNLGGGYRNNNISYNLMIKVKGYILHGSGAGWGSLSCYNAPYWTIPSEYVNGYNTIYIMYSGLGKSNTSELVPIYWKYL